MPSWLIWSAVVCAAFILGFLFGAIVAGDARMADMQRENEEQGRPWND